MKDTGFRPGSRSPFVSAKVAKAIDAPSGLIKTGGHKPQEGKPTRCAQTSPLVHQSVHQDGQTAGVG